MRKLVIIIMAIMAVVTFIRALEDTASMEISTVISESIDSF